MFTNPRQTFITWLNNNHQLNIPLNHTTSKQLLTQQLSAQHHLCPDQLADYLSQYLHVSCIPSSTACELKTQPIISHQLCLNLGVWPVMFNNRLHLMLCSPEALAHWATLQCQTQQFLPYLVMAHHTLFKQLEKQTAITSLPQKSTALSAPLFIEAIAKQASDIHLDPTANGIHIRLRCQGQLTNSQHTHPASGLQLISQLKLLAGCDIAERRRPQDGQFTFTHPSGKKIDCRLSTVATQSGEKCVIRLLHRTDANTWENLGFCHQARDAWQQALRKPNGLLLVTGPTGSGKTTTLYQSLKQLNPQKNHIMTLEDPIEQPLPGVNQIAIHPKAGLNFPALLRHVLRQDPDIIMIGEIRDTETATIAMQAAQTGHLVLATLHTNNAWQALLRLKYLSIPVDLIASAVIGVLAQRLLPYSSENTQKRIGIYEYLPMSARLQNLLLQNALPAEAPDHIKHTPSFKQAAQQHVAQRTLSIDTIKHYLGDDAIEEDT